MFYVLYNFSVFVKLYNPIFCLRIAPRPRVLHDIPKKNNKGRVYVSGGWEGGCRPLLRRNSRIRLPTRYWPPWVAELPSAAVPTLASYGHTTHSAV